MQLTSFRLLHFAMHYCIFKIYSIDQKKYFRLSFSILLRQSLRVISVQVLLHSYIPCPLIVGYSRSYPTSHIESPCLVNTVICRFLLLPSFSNRIGTLLSSEICGRHFSRRFSRMIPPTDARRIAVFLGSLCTD